VQVITTKIKPATNTKGTRMVAQCAAGKFAGPYDHALSADANHKLAATLLIAKLENAFSGWYGEWVAAQQTDGDVWYWVNATWSPNVYRIVIGARR
jgi:hypothetical protein